MVFNSFFFLLIFLPLMLIGWFGLNRVSRRGADLFMIGMSLWFYGAFNPWYLLILAVSLALNYGFGHRIGQSAQHRSAQSKSVQFQSAQHGRPGLAWLITGIAFNLLFLGLFKYAGSGASAAAETAASSGTAFSAAAQSVHSLLAEVGLPVGLSYYTFSQISWLIDLYRGEIRMDSFLTWLQVSIYFPKMAEGPITRYGELALQFQEDKSRRPDAEHMIRGLILLFLGMAKKLLIADALSPAVTYGLETTYYLDTLSSLLVMSGYALQLYFDFSGFCDMAMGVSGMLNIELPLNFDAPFRAPDFAGIWRRWHMTLTRFFTGYVYIPLGGSRRGKARTCLNVMIVFALSGLWHGFSLNFLVWGVLCGLFVVLNNLLPGKNRTASPGKLRTGLVRLLDFFLFAFVFVFFGTSDLGHGMALVRNLFRPAFPGWLFRLGGKFDIPEFWLLNKAVGRLLPGASSCVSLMELCAVVAAAAVLAFGKKTAVQYAQTMRLNRRNAVIMGILTVWCLTSMSGVTTFLYFKF